jgi:hypothetical protein
VFAQAVKFESTTQLVVVNASAQCAAAHSRRARSEIQSPPAALQPSAGARAARLVHLPGDRAAARAEEIRRVAPPWCCWRGRPRNNRQDVAHACLPGRDSDFLKS